MTGRHTAIPDWGFSQGRRQSLYEVRKHRLLQATTPVAAAQSAAATVRMVRVAPGPSGHAAYDFGHSCSAFYDLRKFLLRHPVRRIFPAAESTDPAGYSSGLVGKGIRCSRLINSSPDPRSLRARGTPLQQKLLFLFHCCPVMVEKLSVGHNHSTPAEFALSKKCEAEENPIPVI